MVFVVGPAPFLGRLVVCVYVWVVCSAREGGSRPLLLVCLLVMSVLRFRERVSVVVAGFGKGWWACSGASGSSRRFRGLRCSRVRPQTVCLCRCLPGGVSMVFAYCRAASLSCPVVSCQSSVTGAGAGAVDG